MTWRAMAAPLVALLVVLPVLTGQASAQRPGDRGAERRGDWEVLGSTRIGRRGVDRDEIDVGRREGRYLRIALEARRGNVFVRRIIVVFGNNDKQRIDVRRPLREGQRTPPIDLQGRGRAIKRIEIEARTRGYRPAIVNVLGEPVPDDRWELLGEKRVDRRVDRDTIRVGRKEGRFEKIALEVRDNDVEIRDFKVFFHRGPPQDVRVREIIREGGRTRPIDLQGGDRIIDRIELVYRTRGRGERATVLVYGLEADRRGPPPRPRDRWEELGCQKVGFGADRDTIRVGRREGRFSAIRLRVERSDVIILSLRVLYEHGRPDDFDVGYRIRAGEMTRPLDLRGERRAIKQIDLVYSSIPSLRGSARLCAEGLEDRGGPRRYR